MYSHWDTYCVTNFCHSCKVSGCRINSFRCQWTDLKWRRVKTFRKTKQAGTGNTNLVDQELQLNHRRAALMLAVTLHACTAKTGTRVKENWSRHQSHIMKMNSGFRIIFYIHLRSQKLSLNSLFLILNVSWRSHVSFASLKSPDTYQTGVINTSSGSRRIYSGASAGWWLTLTFRSGQPKTTAKPQIKPALHQLADWSTTLIIGWQLESFLISLIYVVLKRIYLWALDWRI